MIRPKFLFLFFLIFSFCTRCYSQCVNLIPHPRANSKTFKKADLSKFIILDNKLFFKYTLGRDNEKSHLAYFDGKKIRLVPNPDSGRGYMGSPFVFNNQLFFQYCSPPWQLKLGRYNGSKVELIESPKGAYYYMGDVVIDKDRFFFQMSTRDYKNRIASFSNNKIELITNESKNYSYIGPVALEADSLIGTLQKSKVTKKQQLGYVIKGKIVEISNPEEGHGFRGFQVNYLGSNYFRYLNKDKKATLAILKKGRIKLLPIPDSLEYFGNPFIHNEELYFQCVNKVNWRQYLKIWDGVKLRNYDYEDPNMFLLNSHNINGSRFLHLGKLENKKVLNYLGKLKEGVLELLADENYWKDCILQPLSDNNSTHFMAFDVEKKDNFIGALRDERVEYIRGVNPYKKIGKSFLTMGDMHNAVKYKKGIYTIINNQLCEIKIKCK